MTEIRSLTGVRGYAALWVVMMHYTRLDTLDIGPYRAFLSHGFAGVIIFLVLSGFILAYVYGEFRSGVTWPTCRDYFVKRFARVYPLHLLTLLVFAALIVIGVSRNTNNTVFAFVLNVLLLQAWGFVDNFTFNAPAWTISVEAFCYLLFPFVAVTLFRMQAWFAVCALIASLLFIWADPYRQFLLRIGVALPGDGLAYGAFLAQFTAVFIAGAAAFRLAHNGRGNWPRWVGDALLVAGVVAIAYSCSIPLQVWLMTIGGALIVSGLYCDSVLGRAIFGNPVSFFLGEISYAIYLTHILTAMIFPKLHLEALAPKVGLAIIVAAAVHYGFERPARDLIRDAWVRRKLRAVGAAPRIVMKAD